MSTVTLIGGKMSEYDGVSTSTVAVQREAWERICPELGAELAAMVAPPVTVSRFPVAPELAMARNLADLERLEERVDDDRVNRRERVAALRRNMGAPGSYDRAGYLT